MEVQPIYISASVNQTKKSLDWNQNLNLIAYAACNQIFLYDPEQGRVIGVSSESHGAFVTSVQWAKNDYSNNILVSTSSDGSVKLWTVDGNKKSNYIKTSIVFLSKLEGHKGCVSAACAVVLPFAACDGKPTVFAVTTGEDNIIRGWRVEIKSGLFEEVMSHKLLGHSLALELLLISHSWLENVDHWPVMVYGGDDSKVHILTSVNGEEYKETCTLSGHEDWIMSLDYIVDDAGDVLLASGAKNGLIRLWRLSLKLPKNPLSKKTLQVKRLEMKLPIINTNGGTYLEIDFMLESVLHSHEGLVSHLHWSPRMERNESLLLLSCSKTEDRSIIIWQAEEETSESAGVWLEKTRLGEVGGNREGFFNAKFGPDKKKIVATSYQGGLHLWHLINDTWQPQPVVSGHFDEVTDLDWDVDGRYLLTTSKDQTTRLHAEWNKENGKIWQEVARPQVHGFDMCCIACLDKYRFVSGAEEKVIRGFTATTTFVRNLQRITSVSSHTNIELLNLPELASVPSLGLSNKGIDLPNQKIKQGNQSNGNLDKIEPPTEDQLMLGTLWPEVSKLYGHGNEILSLAASNDRTLIASSCRATTELDAIIILWDSNEWKQVGVLQHHRLSVTQMMFSSCDNYLLSVSRDRSWAVFKKDKTNLFSIKFSSGNLNKSLQHSRIIWSCCWLPGTHKFITASRDKTVIVWKPVFNNDENLETINGWEREAIINEAEEVTAVAAISLLTSGRGDQFLVAVGSTSGALHLKVFDNSKGEFTVVQIVTPSHRKTIRRLKFNPRHLAGSAIFLASCSSDNSVVIYSIHL